MIEVGRSGRQKIVLTFSTESSEPRQGLEAWNYHP